MAMALVYGVGLPAIAAFARLRLDPVRAPLRQRFVPLAKDLASPTGPARVRGRVRALRTVPCPFDEHEVVGYVLSVRRSKACDCLADCPHEDPQKIVERDLGALVIEDETATVRFEGRVALASSGKRTKLVSGDVVEVLGVMAADDGGGLDDAPDRSRRIGRVMTPPSGSCGTLVLSKIG